MKKNINSSSKVITGQYKGLKYDNTTAEKIYICLVQRIWRYHEI
ncbi:hypothetical protein [Fusobacterium ulcerans]|nr:hypothetical protein [Fusobacterium ulcerans]